ncbi:MAG: hypothetical protein LAO08_20035 [Acidobacteriia bacterium]|nr:hypothetical protein [Terriglobia bacterium]
MDSAEDTSRAIATGRLPNVVVLEATAKLLDGPRIRNLVQRVPAVLIASRTAKVSLPDTAVTFFRAVLIAEIVAPVREFLARDTT